MLEKNIEKMSSTELLESFIEINDKRKALEKLEDQLKKQIYATIDINFELPYISSNFNKEIKKIEKPIIQQKVNDIKKAFTLFKKQEKITGLDFLDLITVNKSKFKSYFETRKDLVKKFDILIDSNSEIIGYTDCLQVYNIK